MERATVSAVCDFIFVLYSGRVRARQLSFLTQSVETIEKKGFVFFDSAKECKGVRKQQEVKEIGRKDVERLKGWKV